MTLHRHKEFRLLLSILALLFISTVVFAIHVGLPSGFRVSVGLIFLLIIPGLSLSYTFWSHQRFTTLERLLVSVAVSLAIVPTLTFILSKFGFLITGQATFMVVSLIILVGAIGACVRYFWLIPRQRRDRSARDVR